VDTGQGVATQNQEHVVRAAHRAIATEQGITDVFHTVDEGGRFLVRPLAPGRWRTGAAPSPQARVESAVGGLAQVGHDTLLTSAQGAGEILSLTRRGQDSTRSRLRVLHPPRTATHEFRLKGDGTRTERSSVQSPGKLRTAWRTCSVTGWRTVVSGTRA